MFSDHVMQATTLQFFSWLGPGAKACLSIPKSNELFIISGPKSLRGCVWDDWSRNQMPAPHSRLAPFWLADPDSSNDMGWTSNTAIQYIHRMAPHLTYTYSYHLIPSTTRISHPRGVQTISRYWLSRTGMFLNKPLLVDTSWANGSQKHKVDRHTICFSLI